MKTFWRVLVLMKLSGLVFNLDGGRLAWLACLRVHGRFLAIAGLVGDEVAIPE
jgi:hypothetical protein